MHYFDLQESVFNHLWSKHQRDNSFTFSVRQKASKGAETNHFIGKKKSSYFGFTCWDIPVYFPGSSADLTNFIVTVKERCFVRFQYGGMIKTQTDPQSVADLAFGYELLKNLKTAGLQVSPQDDKNKILYYYLELDPKGYESPDEVVKSLEELYIRVAPIVDSSIAAIKNHHPGWQAGRYTNAKFDNLIQKMHTRLEKFAAGTLPESEIEEEAVTEEFLSTATEKAQSHPLNTILYGPPGTGKTYNTINKAVAIADAKFYEADKNNRSSITRRFNELLIKDFDKLEGQVAFCTFHQSMSYEDFVEGIKPKLEEDDSNHLKYSIKDGIFKIIARMAADALEQKETPPQKTFGLSEPEFTNALFYKMSLGNTQKEEDEEIYEYCMTNNVVALGWGGDVDYTGADQAEVLKKAKEAGEDNFSASQANIFINYIRQGDYIIISNGNFRFRAIGKVTGGYEYNLSSPVRYHHFRRVQWVLKDVDLPVGDVYSRNFSQQTLYKLKQQDIKKEFFVPANAPKKAVENKGPLNYVLIIDEINRGNVSQIFGELITLLEDDKRTGKPEALTVTLPYSKKVFSVPPNLYVIGTMNTADRSVEALDTALRRRFVFEEMAPKPELLNSYQRLKVLWVKYKFSPADDQNWMEAEKAFNELFGMRVTDEEGYDNLGLTSNTTEAEIDRELAAIAPEDFKPVVAFDGLNLEKLLVTINERLSVLLTKDHTIGHAWLMDVYCLADLQNAFKNKLLPLLQEYFYNNYAKIGLVLGDAFFEEQKPVAKNIFASFKSGSDMVEDYTDKMVYAFKDTKDLTIEDFKSIYK